METLLASLKILTLLAAIALMLGFIRPVYVLWFLHRNNRLLVLKYYGLPALIFLLFWLFLERGMP
ncbi:hypothetical protein [Cyclobacterium salsum]|uniref:hypothetical protein n=1 Tax=Cyclobacterium salsum TaxID=2666329 RepID=UPI001391495D|nr:hypothetical protein [Cyclobacterium salsum]